MQLGVDEQLLELHVHRRTQRSETPAAFPGQRRTRRTADQNALHHRLEPQVELHRSTHRDAEELCAERRWRRYRESGMAQRAGSAAQLAGVDHEWGARVQASLSALRHDETRGEEGR